MKKVLLVAVAGLFVLASCKKDYTCTCTVSGPQGSISASETINGTKKDAQAECEEGSASSGGYTTTCKIN